MDLLEVKFWGLQDNNKESQNVTINNSYYTECVHTFLLLGLLFLSCSVMSDSLQPHRLTTACQAFLSFTIYWSLLRITSIESVMPSNNLILCRPRLLLPSIFPSIWVFSRVGSAHQVAKVLEPQLQYQSFQWIFRVVGIDDKNVFKQQTFCVIVLHFLKDSFEYKLQEFLLELSYLKCISQT